MRKNGILNAEICHAIAALGHTEYLVIADPGLPIPKGTEVIDISLIPGVPDFFQVLEAVKGDLVIDSYIYAEEMEEKSLEAFQKMQEMLGSIKGSKIKHEEFKNKLSSAKFIIRTGECTPYANVMLEGGVSF